MRYLPYLRSALALSAFATTMLAHAASHYTAAVTPEWDKNWTAFNNFGDYAGTRGAYVHGADVSISGLDPSYYFSGTAINDSGVITGVIYTPSYSRGVIIKDSIATGTSEISVAINNSGTTTGTIRGNIVIGGPPYEPTYNTHASQTAGDTTWDLGTLGGNSSYAFDINNKGQSVGYSELKDQSRHSFLYSDGKMVDLGDIGSSGQSQATGINDQGLIIGDVTGPNWGQSRAYVYDHGKVSLIDTPADLQSQAKALNNWGQVVGTMWNQDTGRLFYGYLYENGQAINLNSLLDPGAGWDIQQALDINDRGQILVYACNSGSNCGSVVLSPDVLSPLPVPEPDTYAMLLGGLGILGWAARRKRTVN